MDMFMKSLKTLVHTTHSELKKTVPTIKKSHLYEAIASYCGFRSYAAFQASFPFDKTLITDDELAKGQCFDRMVGMGCDAADALVVSQHMTKLYEALGDLNLDDIWDFYIGSSYDERLQSSHILEGVKVLIESGDIQAKLIGLVLTTEVLAEYEENPDNRSGKYWHNKRLANDPLNGMQAEVADSYLHTQCYREFLDFLLSGIFNKELPVLPSPSIINAVISKFDGNTKREWTTLFSESPYSVIEAIEFVQHYRDSGNKAVSPTLYMDWYKAEVVLHPYKEMLAEVIENAASHDEKWFWHYFGLAHDFDVTQNAYIAINSYTGEEWDGYGPMEAGGYEGIALPEILESLKVEMREAVASAFS